MIYSGSLKGFACGEDDEASMETPASVPAGYESRIMMKRVFKVALPHYTVMFL